MSGRWLSKDKRSYGSGNSIPQSADDFRDSNCYSSKVRCISSWLIYLLDPNLKRSKCASDKSFPQGLTGVCSIEQSEVYGLGYDYALLNPTNTRKAKQTLMQTRQYELEPSTADRPLLLSNVSCYLFVHTHPRPNKYSNRIVNTWISGLNACSVFTDTENLFLHRQKPTDFRTRCESKDLQSVHTLRRWEQIKFEGEVASPLDSNCSYSPYGQVPPHRCSWPPSQKF